MKKVHRVIQYEQSTWLKPYIDLNTRLRIASTSKFEKDFFKLMNNSVFGKTMENVRKHKNIKLITNEKKFKKEVMKPNFKGPSIRFSENLMAVEMGKTHIKMTKPVYLGQAILDLSKMVMYEFHYDYMLPKYGEKVKLCYMDTDSFVYRIETFDFYKDVAGDVKERFDTSKYPEVKEGDRDYRPLTVGLNMMKIGMMKDELCGKIMIEFIALRAKLYAYKMLDEKNPEEKKCKGVKKCVVEKALSFDDYKRCLEDGKNIYREQILFQNKKHNVYTSAINKIALNRDDDKRIIQPDLITTKARGHYK